MLQRHLNMSYSEVYKLPVAYRRWFINRLVEETKRRNEPQQAAQGSDTNHSNINKLKQYEDMLSKKS